METKFTCSKSVLKKARVICWFYAAVTLIGIVLFLLPLLLNGLNTLGWFSVIYVVIALFMFYKGYRAFRVLRALRNSSFCVYYDTVSGVSIRNSYQKAVSFQIRKDEISSIDEEIVAVESKTDITYSRWMHRSPISSPSIINGYKSTVIRTKDEVYTLFGIELTEEIKEALASE